MGHALELTERVSAAAYFELDSASATRLELYKGNVYAMAGAGKKHNLTCKRLARAFDSRLPAGCTSYSENVKTELARGETYYYPDLVVECNPHLEDEYIIHHPILVAEVHSPSTQRIDESEKLPAYLEVPSIKHILMLNPEKESVAHYFRNEANEWQVDVLRSPNAVLTVATWAISIPLTELFG